MSGLFGVVSNANCMDELFYGTDYQSHLGTEFGGLAIGGEALSRAIHRISNGQFKNLFYGFYHRHEGTCGVGVISDSNPQPIIVKSVLGTFTVVTAGLIENAREVEEDLLAGGVTFSEVVDGQLNQTELVAQVISHSPDILTGIRRVFDRVQGSLSLLLMNEDGIYAASDRNGRLPLTVGRKGDCHCVTSETCAFPNLGLRTVRTLEGGEIVLISDDGVCQLEAPAGTKEICTFLWIYTGYPASSYEGISVEAVRERCGRALARKDVVAADLAAGVPDSGTGHAVGYAVESGLPFRRPLVKYAAGYGRSYIPPSQEVRDRIAKMKLIPIEDIIRGKRLIICEDSIVRGTQLKNLTIQKLWEAGAAEVHVRVACPPLMFPCRYNLSTQTSGELVARRAIMDIEGKSPDPDTIAKYLDPASDAYAAMIEWIRADLGCTSLDFLTMDEVIQAVQLDRADLCTCCWRGYS